MRSDLRTDIHDAEVRDAAVEQMRRAGVVLPTIAELAEPSLIPDSIQQELRGIDADAAHPLNLFRVHWHNDYERVGQSDVPGHLVLTEELTGVPSPILIAIGDRFPMISAHKVLAAYGCLLPRLISGRFDPRSQRAVWPSTGNYCRGGVAISRVMGCRGAAVLPEGMSKERFQWLADWVESDDDVIRTPGTESNVKEIYDACAELARDERNVIFNQFSEYSNHVIHRCVTGPAMEHIFEAAHAKNPQLNLAAFVSATGSAGTIAAGDHLAATQGSRTVAVEALECPTLLYNGFGEHNIQGIGDKHVPLIHNVMGTDMVVAISDQGTDRLNVMFQSEAGREWLRSERGVDDCVLEGLAHLGISSICNVLAAITVSKKLGLGRDDAILTVATDGAAMYASESDKVLARDFGGQFGHSEAGSSFDSYVLNASTEHSLELSERDRNRIFNLGYFTWVEQQGVSLADFEARRAAEFWDALPECVPSWDRSIQAINDQIRAGVES